MWCPGPESNQRHADFQSASLPTELPGQTNNAFAILTLALYELRSMMSSAQVRKFGRCDREGGMQFLKAALALPESTSEVDVPSITVRCFGTSNSYGGARQETRGPRNIPRSWGNAKPLLPSKRICRKARY